MKAIWKNKILAQSEFTWNVNPLLNEVRHALKNLLASGETTIIDLRSIPLSPGEEVKILHILGKGEVQSRLNAMGLSEIFETQYSGVWVVTHFNSDAEIMSRFIEITTVPEILCSQIEDISIGYEELVIALEEEQDKNEPEEEILL